jgi:hypothetical protein
MLALGSFVDSGEPEPIVRPSGLIQGPIKAAPRAWHHSPVAFRGGKAHVVKRMDHPHVRIIPEWFGGGALTRKELDEAAKELLAGEAGLVVVGEATIEPALDKAFTGTARVFKREVQATVDEITTELQEAFEG